MGGEVGAAPAQPPGAPGEHELRADAVGRGGEQPSLVEREEAGEGTEGAGDAWCRRFSDRRSEPLDDRVEIVEKRALSQHRG